MTHNKTSEDAQNGNCAKPLLAVVDFFNGYFSTVLSKKKTNIYLQ
jgi:hypothetical protein